LFASGSIYLNGFDDCSSMTETYHKLQERFPSFVRMDEVLFNLYYCNQSSGNTKAASQLKQKLIATYPNSRLTTIATTGKDPSANQVNPAATAAYEKIYDQFIEGNFKEAIDNKKSADSIYGQGFWTPQQMYIESVYYIRERQDSTALDILNKINSRYLGTELADKAKTMIDVLGRRSQIEEELRNLQVERPPEDTCTVTEVFRVIRPDQQDVVTTKPTEQPKEVEKKIIAPSIDSVITKPVITAAPGY